MGGNSAELERNGRKNDHRDAKFTVLAESVRHHIKEEESEHGHGCEGELAKGDSLGRVRKSTFKPVIK